MAVLEELELGTGLDEGLTRPAGTAAVMLISLSQSPSCQQ